MTTEHEHVLAAIERRALSMGLPADEIDSHIADELRVPRDHYVAYLLVGGAIESYRLVHHHESGAGRAPAADAGETAETARILRRIWEHAGAIHEAAVSGGDIRPLVRQEARGLIGELLALSEHLLATPVPTTSTRQEDPDA